MNECSDLALQPPGTGELPFKIDYTLFYFLMSQVYFSVLEVFADKTNTHSAAVIITTMFTIVGKRKNTGQKLSPHRIFTKLKLHLIIDFCTTRKSSF